jgi:hypothetical protein
LAFDCWTFGGMMLPSEAETNSSRPDMQGCRPTEREEND